MIQRGGGKMNPVLEAIKKRRSVRSYESKPIPKDVITVLKEGQRPLINEMTYLGNIFRKYSRDLIRDTEPV
jgi:hypothetical protein